MCWFTPGTTGALFLAVYMKWIWQPSPPNPIWHQLVVCIAVATVFLGCAAFAGAIHAAKSGSEKRVRKAIEFAAVFLLGQLIVAPLLGMLLAGLLFLFTVWR